MYKYDLIIGKEYLLAYDEKNPKIVKLLYVDGVGDCDIQFKNNKKDCYHCSYLLEISIDNATKV